MRSRKGKKGSFFLAYKQRFKGGMKCIHVMRLIHQQSFVEDSFLFLFFWVCFQVKETDLIWNLFFKTC